MAFVDFYNYVSASTFSQFIVAADFLPAILSPFSTIDLHLPSAFTSLFDCIFSTFSILLICFTFFGFSALFSSFSSIFLHFLFFFYFFLWLALPFSPLLPVAFSVFHTRSPYQLSTSIQLELVSIHELSIHCVQLQYKIAVCFYSWFCCFLLVSFSIYFVFIYSPNCCVLLFW